MLNKCATCWKIKCIKVIKCNKRYITHVRKLMTIKLKKYKGHNYPIPSL